MERNNRPVVQVLGGVAEVTYKGSEGTPYIFDRDQYSGPEYASFQEGTEIFLPIPCPSCGAESLMRDWNEATDVVYGGKQSIVTLQETLDRNAGMRGEANSVTSFVCPSCFSAAECSEMNIVLRANLLPETFLQDKESNRAFKQEIQDYFGLYSQDDGLVEIETWTSAGVNMIFHFQEGGEKSLFEQYRERVDTFDVDEEIELHRQNQRYREDFSFRESIEDFFEFQSKLKRILTEVGMKIRKGAKSE